MFPFCVHSCIGIIVIIDGHHRAPVFATKVPMIPTFLLSRMGNDLAMVDLPKQPLAREMGQVFIGVLVR